MPIGDGCGWGSSTKNSSVVGLLKGASNAVTGPITTALGGVVSAVSWPFASNSGKWGYDVAKSLQIDSDGVCYDICNNNETMSWDGELCIDQNGKERPRVASDIKNIKRHNAIDYLWNRDLRPSSDNPSYVDNISIAPQPADSAAAAAAAPAVPAAQEAPAAASGRRKSKKKCGRGKVRDLKSKRCRRKKCSRGKVRDLKSKRCRKMRHSK